MENNYLLNKEYIRIKNMNTISYGGNQSWCRSKKMQKVGCGVTVSYTHLTLPTT